MNRTLITWYVDKGGAPKESKYSRGEFVVMEWCALFGLSWFQGIYVVLENEKEKKQNRKL